MFTSGVHEMLHHCIAVLLMLYFRNTNEYYSLARPIVN